MKEEGSAPSLSTTTAGRTAATMKEDLRVSNILRDCVIVIAGDFGRARTYPKIKRWIDSNGGLGTNKISSKSTHLVCDRSNWNNKSAIVQKAMTRGNIKIVNYDWLEKSCQCKIRLDANPYLWIELERQIKYNKEEAKAVKETLLKNEKQGLIETAADDCDKVRKFQAGCVQAQRDLQSDNYHVYRDFNAFQYNIILSRPDIQKNRNERYRLTIYESHIQFPVLYACTATYSVPGSNPITHIIRERGSSYEQAFAAWRQFFRAKTGVEWDYRWHGRQKQNLKSWEKMEVYTFGTSEPEGTVADLTLEEKELGKKKKYFLYTLPDTAKGEPPGEAPLYIEACQKYGRPPQGLRQVGGEESEDDLDAE